MHKLKRLLPSPSMVVAFVALFVAAAGGAVAATKIGSRQIANNSIRSIDVKNRSLLSKDFKAGQLPRGPQGASGPQGPRGLAGAAGAPGAPGAPGQNGFGRLAYPFAVVDIPNGGTDGAVAVCPDGTFPTGGDAVVQTNPPVGDPEPVAVPLEYNGLYFEDGAPLGWVGALTNNTGGPVTLFVDAVCANASQIDPVQSRAGRAKATR